MEHPTLSPPPTSEEQDRSDPEEEEVPPPAQPQSSPASTMGSNTSLDAKQPSEPRANSQPPPVPSSGVGGIMTRFNIKKHKKVDLASFPSGEEAVRAPPSETERRASGDDSPKSNVLKKAASMVLDQTSPETKGQRPKFALEQRTDFKDMDRFEGRMFLGWIARSLCQDQYLKVMLTEKDTKFVGSLFGSLLLKAGVMKPLEATEFTAEFREDLIYSWCKSSQSSPSLKNGCPGKVDWRPPVANGDSRPGAKYTEAELQQALMAEKREHKQIIEVLRKEQDEALFKIRGEQAVHVEHYLEKIASLERMLESREEYSTSGLQKDGSVKSWTDEQSPAKLEIASVSRTVEGRVSEVVRQEVPDAFVVYSPKGIHKGIQVDTMSKSSEGPRSNTKLISKGIQVSQGEDVPSLEETLPSSLVSTLTSSTDFVRAHDSVSSPHGISSLHSPTPPETVEPELILTPTTGKCSNPPPPPPPPPPSSVICGPPPTGMNGPPPPPPPPPLGGVGGPPPPPPPGGVGGPPPPPPPPPGMVGGPPPPPPPSPGMVGGPPPPPPPPGGIGGPHPPPPPGCPPLPGLPPPPPAAGTLGPPIPLNSATNQHPVSIRKPLVTTKSTMRPLFWTRIQVVAPVASESSSQLSGNLWEELEETPIEVDEFDGLFSQVQVKSKSVKQDVNVEEEKPKKVSVVKILDQKRSQKIGIFVKSAHLDKSTVDNAIYNFDNSAIDFETLKQIKTYKASVTDAELIQFREQVALGEAPLDKPEQFILDLSNISNFQERLECFMFQTNFMDSLADIEHRMNNINHVCDQLTKSSSMRQVFSIILSLGNYMNGGNRQRGQADGFAIDILPKLKDVKAKDNATTLLQYIVRYWILMFDPKKGTPEVQLPVPEPSDVEKSSNINFEEEKAECSKLETKLKSIESAKDKVIQETDAEHLEPFQQKMTEFLSKATVSLKELTDLVDDCTIKFVRTMQFYQFRPKEDKLGSQPKEFFGVWHPFCEDFKNLWKSEQAKIEKELLMQERMKHQQKKESLRAFKTEPTKPRGLKEKMLRKKSKMNVGK